MLAFEKSVEKWPFAPGVGEGRPTAPTPLSHRPVSAAGMADAMSSRHLQHYAMQATDKRTEGQHHCIKLCGESLKSFSSNYCDCTFISVVTIQFCMFSIIYTDTETDLQKKTTTYIPDIDFILYFHKVNLTISKTTISYIFHHHSPHNHIRKTL